MYKLDSCPVCASNSILKKEIEQVFTYKGSELKIPHYVIFECTNCGETFPDEEQLKSLEPIIRDFHRREDGLLSPEDIRKIRKGLGLTQEKIGEILGGGAKAFARYENGSVTQSKPMDNLIKVVWAIPSALEVLRDSGHGNIVKISSPRIPYQMEVEPEKIYNLKMGG
ncbi:MAG: transcriptional regulator with domain [Fibrobacteres bacterium]|nr:transcriptional regulator with domain [Fibrobacterota bacterium]